MKRLFLLVPFTLLLINPLYSQLVFTVDTQLSDSLNIGIEVDAADSIVVNWGDGSAEQTFQNQTMKAAHNYAAHGEYTITVSGKLNRLYFTKEAAEALTTVESFHNLGLTHITFISLGSGVQGAENLIAVPDSLPSTVTSLDGTFLDAAKFNDDISGWDVSNVTQFGNFLNDAREFSGDLSSWDVSNATNMRFMFYRCRAFNSDISGWNTANVTNMEYMFHTNLVFNQDLSNWDVGNVTTMRLMFYQCPEFNSPLNSWNVSKVTTMELMFEGALRFNQDLNQWDMSSVRSIRNMFANAVAFNGNVSTWDVSGVTNMSAAFRRARAFNADISNWDVSNVSNFSSMFAEADLFNVNIGTWNTSSATNMSAMFTTAINFNQDISSWDVSKVTTLRDMFFRARLFNADIGNWNTGSLTDIFGLFREAESFNQDITGWDFSNITSMGYLFAGASSFNQPVESIDVSKVIDLNSVFDGATSFNQDVSGWDVSNVEYFNSTFRNASSFNQDISGWDVSKALVIRGMFNGATAFNQDLSGWRVNKVENFDSIFDGATSFNGDISSWEIQSSTRLDFMLNNTNLSIATYDKILNSWAAYDSNKTEVSFGAGSNRYSLNALDARNTLVDSLNWTIADGGSVVPTLISPDNEALVDSNYTANLVWRSLQGATRYQIQITAEGTNYTTTALDTIVADTSLITLPLTHNTAFSWRVRGGTTTNFADWSESSTFTTPRNTSILDEAITNLPTEFALAQNYPNPFNPTTQISFDLPESSFVTLGVYNINGQEVATLVNKALSAGSYSFTFNAANLPSGLYLYRLEAGNKQFTNKMMLLK